MPVDIYSLKLENIIPENLLIDKNVKAILHALNPEGISISEKLSEALILSRIDELDEPVIDLLASQFHVDFYDLAGTLKMKRESVKGSLLWHMKKGTQWAIEKALSMIGIEAEFLHWHDTGDEPYTFRIKAKITGDFYRTQGKDKIISSIRRAVNESKAARSLMTGLDTSIEFKDESKIYAGLFDALTGFQVIGLAKIEGPGATKIFAGLANALEGNHKIRLAHAPDETGNVYAGLLKILNINHEIGLEEEVMQELLLRFEKRIFERLDAVETNVNRKIAEHESQIEMKLNEILDLLKWKGPDEPL